MGRFLLPLIVMAFAAFAACETNSPTAPQVATPSVVTLHITGSPAAIASKATTQLAALVTLDSGAVKMCAAAWTVDDPRVAVVSATCAGLSAQARVRVDGVMGEAYEFGVPGGACEVHVNWSHIGTPRRMRIAITALPDPARHPLS